MNLWLIVPIKPLSQGKSRLAPSLAEPDRRRLSQELLEKTLAVVFGVDELAGVIVVSRDAEALAVAQEAGAVTLTEVEHPRQRSNGPDPETEPEHTLNEALRQARQNAVARGAGAILVLPADLPLLSSAEILALVRRGKALEQGLVIVASHDGGTNALLVKPPHAIDFAYGPDSFRRHIAQANNRGLPIQIVESPALALDLDLPEDLVRWQTLQQC